MSVGPLELRDYDEMWIQPGFVLAFKKPPTQADLEAVRSVLNLIEETNEQLKTVAYG